MKRIIGVLLCAMILLSAFSGAVFASGTPTIEVGDVSAAAGRTVELPIRLKQNPGVVSVEFSVQYDAKQLTLTNVQAGEYDGSFDWAAGYPVTWYSTDPKTNETKDGTIAVLVFDVAENATYGKKTVTVTYGPDYIYNADEENVPFAVASGGITVLQAEAQTQTETAPTVSPKMIAFTDVSANDWYETWIIKAVNMGLFNGNADGTFHPNDPITRAQFVTVLWRMVGKPLPRVALPFTDVRGESEEFRNAIAWAYENGVVNGTSETAFSPRGALTREAAMTILFRLGGAKSGMESLMTKIYDDTFTDSGAISAWAKPALYWGIYNEIISGTSAKTLSPQGTATRAQIAKILVGYSEKD